MRCASLFVLLAGCDRVFGLFPLVEPDRSVDATTTIDAPPPQACPPSYGVTLPSSTSKYRHEAAAVETWQVAADLCKGDSMVAGSYTHLLVLSNDTERAELLPHIGATDLWIGYSDLVFDNVFQWVTAESTGTYPIVHMPPWDDDDPDKIGPGCVNLRPDGSIGDKGCTEPFGFVCECDGYPDLDVR